MSWKVIFEVTESAENSCMTCILSDGDPDRFFSTPGTNEDCGEFLLDNADYSPSSPPQRFTLNEAVGLESIFTFGWEIGACSLSEFLP